MRVTLHPPFYLLRSFESCWKCRKEAAAIAFAVTAVTPHDDEDEVDDFSPLILRDIQDAPHPFIAAAAQTEAHFQKGFSRTSGREYFMNHCTCGAAFGDHFLHSEPGHAFFPTDEGEAALIHIQEIDWDEDLECDCWFAGWSSLSPFEHGTRVEEPIRIPR